MALTAKYLVHADPSFTYRVYVHLLEEAEQRLFESMDATYGPDTDGHERTEHPHDSAS